MNKPDPTEYAPYFEKYISLVPEGEIVVTLGLQIESTLSLIRGLSAAQGDLRYAPGKWSVKEVIGHLIDAERIFAYRALRFARNDATPRLRREQFRGRRRLRLALPGRPGRGVRTHAQIERLSVQEPGRRSVSAARRRERQ